MTCVHRSVRVHVRADAIFVREVEEGIMHVPAYFTTMPQDVYGASDIDIHAITRDLITQVENWNGRGNGFVIDQIVKFVLCITKYRPLHGSSFIKTPEHIARKHCVVNVKNDDNLCFLWAVLSCLYEPQYHKERISSYVKHKNSLNVEGLKFPLDIKSIPKFEQLNPTISVNVLSEDNESRGFCIEYLSAQRARQHHINLLVLDNGTSSNRHYVWIKDMSRLVASRTKHDGATYVCNSCLYPFSRADLLTQHEPYCLRHPPQMVKYPDPQDPDKCILKFRAHKKQFHLPFYLICDFECFLTPTDNNDDDITCTRIIDEHNVSGFACYRVTEFDEYRTDPVVYSGENVMSEFYSHIMSESNALAKIIGAKVPMIPLTEQQQSSYDEAERCINCGQLFTEINWKVRHHCHVSSNFLFAACNNCNLQLKTTPTKRKPKKESNRRTKSLDNRTLPTMTMMTSVTARKRTMLKTTFYQ